MGVEPIHVGFADQCLPTWLLRRYRLIREKVVALSNCNCRRGTGKEHDFSTDVNLKGEIFSISAFRTLHQGLRGHGGSASLLPVRELIGWKVDVREVRFMPELDAPVEKPYPFLYAIQIRNESEEIVTLRGRKWVVREDDGETIVVEGEGVVGEMPCFEPGDEFTYNSYHVVAESATADGAYFGETASGEAVFTRIPQFRLEVP